MGSLTPPRVLWGTLLLARLPEPATEYDHSGLTNFNPVGLTSPKPVGDSGIYLLRTAGLRAPSSPIPGVGLGGLVPRTESTALGRIVLRTERTALGGLVPLAESTVLGELVPRTEHAALGGISLTSTAFHDCRTHEPRLRIDSLSAPQGRFVARVSASIATTESCTGRGSISTAAETVFAFGFCHVHRGRHGLRRRPGCTPIAQPTPLSRSSTQETDPPRPLGRLCPSLPCLALQPLRRRRRADEHRQRPVLHRRCRLWIRARRGPSAISQTRDC